MVADGAGGLTREHLTERLRVSGALPAGRVTAVHAGEVKNTILSTIVSYRVEYSSGAPPHAPTRMILKGAGSGIDPLFRRASELEVEFYRQAAPLTPAGLVPVRYDAEVTDAGVRVLLDYRQAVLGALMIPVWQQSLGIPPAVWWSHLNRLLAAVDDLDCAQLLS